NKTPISRAGSMNRKKTFVNVCTLSEDHRGNMVELTEDSPQVMDQLRSPEMLSCSVLEGYWILYELPKYRGHQYLLRAGEYRRFSEWGAMSGRVGSLRRATDLY
uniref:Beta/gamma crystallin 'Greek key' domain-containing protein n=1 Tax=Chelonoidis abingdonii TaxID=106734 RepID=A0A8C0J9R3_CHEAB